MSLPFSSSSNGAEVQCQKGFLMNKKSLKIFGYMILALALWFSILMGIRLYSPYYWHMIQHAYRQQIQEQEVRFHISKQK